MTKKKEESNLVAHAKAELDLLGMGENADDMDKFMRDAVLDIVKKFAEQGHSGFSASYAVSVLSKLLAYEPLSPLTGKDDEWVEVSEGMWQNKRCSHVFKDKTHAYDIEGKIFRDPDGSTWVNGESHVTVTFPYTPTREYVDREDEDDGGAES